MMVSIEKLKKEVWKNNSGVYRINKIQEEHNKLIAKNSRQIRLLIGLLLINLLVVVLTVLMGW